MSASEAPALLWERDVVRCNHLRQRHPLHQDLRLAGLRRGTRNRMNHVPVEEDVGRTPTPVRLERETLPQQSGRLSFRWKIAL
jgi:hypothetical protein